MKENRNNDTARQLGILQNPAALVGGCCLCESSSQALVEAKVENECSWGYPESFTLRMSSPPLAIHSQGRHVVDERVCECSPQVQAVDTLTQTSASSRVHRDEGTHEAKTYSENPTQGKNIALARRKSEVN